MTDFAAKRHFGNPDFSGTKVTCSISSFMRNYVDSQGLTESMFIDGYAPFCKHLFVVNFTSTKSGVARITSRNRMHLRTGYLARREEELPVLARWFDSLDVNSVESKCEAPMNPITMMRNALGKDEGGSGVPLDKAEYARAVIYWSEYATIR